MLRIRLHDRIFTDRSYNKDKNHGNDKRHNRYQDANVEKGELYRRPWLSVVMAVFHLFHSVVVRESRYKLITSWYRIDVAAALFVERRV